MEKLQNQNNLLAFSAGVDSTALFFYLLERNIPFDIAIVNYHTRVQSNEEVAYAKELAKKYNKKIYVKDCFLEKFSEKEARDCRYKFFEEIIKKHGYENLFLAHQLNDRFEWFLMQFSKGAGLNELVAMDEKEERDFYKIYRPFYNISRDEILTYLNELGVKYFYDESNSNVKFKRNLIRHKFSNEFISLFANGVKKSFEYLQKDKKLLFDKRINRQKKMYFFEKSNPQIDIRIADKIIKKLGVLLTSKQREEIKKTNFSCVIQGKIAIDSNEKHIYISPYIKLPIPKKFKEKMRKGKIPPKIRGYFYKNLI
ncbi:tRNA(Ile)-lysidine synthase [Lebetimonas natsushimae]|uniref:tRNA(Ile)-lysidine synthase n=1 Tax=Lebetimonas natsushimae TaxID=1936991 RepID=A0A292YAI1_9BACT|nr:tRNA lysidine(34) synthetase TilS [Lebetimonas natsushimae]GAX87067.1 tRNA(Ile)-lysidine synthase [Lebetimonas natsushimae]